MTTTIDPETGLFAGLSKDTKARAILNHLSVDTEVTLQDLMSATGFTASQVHNGIRHLREAAGYDDCVITRRSGANSTYRLAETAVEVRDYAQQRMRHWRTQMTVMQSEMETAMGVLEEGDAIKVQAAAAVLGTLLRTLELGDAMDRDLERRERRLQRQQERLRGRRPARRRETVAAVPGV